MATQELMAEEAFNEVMLNTYKEAAALGYRATYFLRMMGELGAVKTAKELVVNQKFSSGFTQLWELKRLDLSAEALIWRPEFQHLFTEDELVKAKEKLAKLGYKVGD